MPFAFKLPTTSSLFFQDYLASDSHPSLPTSTTTARAVLRSALKRHKRLPIPSQPAHLSAILTCLNTYTPLLLAIYSAISGARSNEHGIRIKVLKEVEVEWRAYLTSGIPGREAQRVKLQGFDSELFFTLLTLGETHYLLARTQLHALYDATTPTADQRTAAITTAMKHLLEAHEVFTYAHNHATGTGRSSAVADISAETLGALAALSLAEATLLAVLKDDPYPAAVTQDRNKNDKDWMVGAVSIPKVRAHLFARLCIAASEHAARSLAMFGSVNKPDAALLKYLDDLKKTARAKVCRFFAIDAEIGAQTGVGIAWLQGAKKELGLVVEGKEEGGRFARMKNSWAERKEDRKVEKGADWGGDGGRFEEGRVVEMLLAKWTKMNDTVNVQLVPSSDPLIANMPSGREWHNPKPWALPVLDSVTLMQMRAPPDPSQKYRPDDGDSDDEEASDPVGAFPGTSSEYSKAGSAYY